MLRILVVDADPQLRQSFEKLLLDKGYRVSLATSGEEALDTVWSAPPDLVVMDVQLPFMAGLEALKAIREIEPRLPVIIMTGSANTEEAIEATKLGAFDYVLKPFKDSDMVNIVRQALDAGRIIRSRVEIDQAPASSTDDALIGRSKPMQELYKAIGLVAPTEATVLIKGESGTGKELVARAIYQHSHRADKSFVVINSVAIPETLLESELFGYEKGAFTGAINRKIGKIEHAEGGTAFLDEIGDMSLGVQAKILRLLQDKKIERIGSHRPIPVDVRIIAATNRDLEAAVREGLFRQDLYYRLNVVSLTLPPLRERPEDIPLLCDYFLERFARSLSVRNPGLTKEALTLLSRHPWSGNVRELANAMEQCLIFSRGRPIGMEEVKSLVLPGGRNLGVAPGFVDESIRQWARQAMVAGMENLLAYLSDHVARIIISEALIMSNGNRTRAARYLGLSRPSLLARMDKYNLRIKFPSRPV